MDFDGSGPFGGSIAAIVNGAAAATVVPYGRAAPNLARASAPAVPGSNTFVNPSAAALKPVGCAGGGGGNWA